jgi:hypothetical protein
MRLNTATPKFGSLLKLVTELIQSYYNSEDPLNNKPFIIQQI